MTQPVGKVYVSGDGISDIRILDSETLCEVERIPTETNENYRLVVSESLEEGERDLIAFSEYEYSARVFVHNSFTNERLSHIVNVPGEWGLEILSSSSLLCSPHPIIVSGGQFRLCAYNALTTQKLIDCQNLSFANLKRIKRFPEWNLNELFVGGKGRNGTLNQYDLNRDCVPMGSYAGHVGSSYGYSYVNGITTSLTDGILISGSDDDGFKGTLKLWSKDTFECIESVRLDKGCFSLEYFSDSHLVCCGTKNEIEIWDIRKMRNRLKKVRQVGNGAIHDLDSISFSNSPLFVSGSSSGFVSIWNPSAGKVLRACSVGGRIWGIRFLRSFDVERRAIREENRRQLDAGRKRNGWLNRVTEQIETEESRDNHILLQFDEARYEREKSIELVIRSRLQQWRDDFCYFRNELHSFDEMARISLMTRQQENDDARRIGFSNRLFYALITSLDHRLEHSEVTLDELDRYLQINSTSLRKSIQLNLLKGRILRLNGLLEEALEVFEDCCSHQPNLINAFLERARTYILLEKRELALSDFEQCIQIDLNHERVIQEKENLLRLFVTVWACPTPLQQLQEQDCPSLQTLLQETHQIPIQSSSLHTTSQCIELEMEWQYARTIHSLSGLSVSLQRRRRLRFFRKVVQVPFSFTLNVDEIVPILVYALPRGFRKNIESLREVLLLKILSFSGDIPIDVDGIRIEENRFFVFPLLRGDFKRLCKRYCPLVAGEYRGSPLLWTFEDSRPDHLIDPRNIRTTDQIGRGAFGSVRRGVMKVGLFEQEVAVKSTLIDMTAARALVRREEEEEEEGESESISRSVLLDRAIRDNEKEFKVQLSVHEHANVIRLYGCYVGGEYNDVFHVVMELCEGGQLDHWLQRQERDGTLTIGTKIRLLIEIANGMTFLHQNHIIHRDLKPGNILLTNDGTIKICDFGLARSLESMSSTLSVKGTVGYIPPPNPNGNDDEESAKLIDVYAFGILMWETLTLQKAYCEQRRDGIDEMDLLLKIRHRGLRPDLSVLPNDCPQELNDLCVLCWSDDPSDRLPFGEILIQLREIAEGL